MLQWILLQLGNPLEYRRQAADVSWHWFNVEQWLHEPACSEGLLMFEQWLHNTSPYPESEREYAIFSSVHVRRCEENYCST